MAFFMPWVAKFIIKSTIIFMLVLSKNIFNVKWVVIISEVQIVLLSVLLSACVSYGLFKLEWNKKIEAERIDQDKKRYVMLSAYKAKLLELPIFLEHIFNLDNMHGQRTAGITYQDYKDRIIEKHQETVEIIDSIFSDSNLFYLETEDIDILFKLKEETRQSHIDILNDNFYSEDVKKDLSDRGSHLMIIINELPGSTRNTTYLEELKFEFGWS